MPIQVMRSSGGRMSRGLTAIVLAAGLWCPAGVQAAVDDAVPSMFSVHGFGTLGEVHSDARDADYVGSPFQPNGAGYSTAWSPGVDSKLGLQIGGQFGERLSAIVQVVSQHLYDNTWRPQIEWANLKYQLTPDFSIRAGRSVAAPFLISDARFVGYTYPWIRPPSGLYGELPVSNHDGIDLNYHLHSGAVTQTLGLSYGQSNLKIMGGGEVSARKFLQASDAMEVGPLTFRIGYTSLRATTHIPTFDPLFSGFEQFGAAATEDGFPVTGAQASALGATYSLRGSSSYAFSMATVGVSYDPGDWLLMSEWATTSSDGILRSSQAWYVMAGHRFGAFTPYLTVARLKSASNFEPGISTTGLPAPLAAAAATLNDGLSAALRNFAPSQSSGTLGVRWDLENDIDLKLQYDRVRIDANSIGRLGNVQPGFRPGPDVNVVSVAMDFVF